MVTPDHIYTNDGCRATLASPGNLGNACHQHLASESKQEDVQGDVGCHVNSGEDIDASQMMQQTQQSPLLKCGTSSSLKIPTIICKAEEVSVGGESQ